MFNYFRKINEKIFDKIDILVRETIQNPLDNPSNNGKPIRIKFKQDYINVSEIPCKNELLETMNALYKSIESYKKSEKGIADEFTEYYKNAVNSLVIGHFELYN